MHQWAGMACRHAPSHAAVQVQPAQTRGRGKVAGSGCHCSAFSGVPGLPPATPHLAARGTLFQKVENPCVSTCEFKLLLPIGNSAFHISCTPEFEWPEHRTQVRTSRVIIPALILVLLQYLNTFESVLTSVTCGSIVYLPKRRTEHAVQGLVWKGFYSVCAAVCVLETTDLGCVPHIWSRWYWSLWW